MRNNATCHKDFILMKQSAFSHCFQDSNIIYYKQFLKKEDLVRFSNQQKLVDNIKIFTQF